MAGYTRQSTYTDGDVINASDSNDEFDQLLAAFNNTTGHKHDGTSAEGPVIGLIGDPGVATPLNKVVVDDTNNRVGFFVDVSSVSTEQLRVQDGAVVPVTNNDVDLGTSSLQFKDLHIDGVANVDSIAMPTTTVTDILDEDAMTSNSATALATQQSIKAYVDAQVTAQDLDFQADTGGALNIDLDSETLTFTGGTGIDTSGSGNAVTFAIDSTVATLTGSQTITNKTIDFDNNTVSNIEVDNLKTGVLDTDLSSVAATDTTLASAKAIKAYVDAQVTAQDLDFQGDSGGALSIDLDSETLDIAGGTGIDTSGSGNTLTVAIDSTVATLTGAQTLTNKSIDASQLTGTVANARLDAELQALAGLTSAADKGIQFTGIGTAATYDLTAAGKALLDDADASAQRTTLGLGTAATTASTDYATAAQGALADSALQDVVDDTTPQLGGNLDVQSNTITTSTVNGGITLSPNGTGNVTLGTMVFNADQSIGAGQDNFVLTYDNSAGTISLEASSGGSSEVVDDTTPQLGGNLDTNGNNINFGDNDKAQFGAGNDLQIYHDATDSYVENNTGELYVQADNITVRSDTGTETFLTMDVNDGVDLYFNNTKKIETTATGITVTGTAIATTDTDTTNTGSVTLDFGANQNFVLTLTGNVTLANPSTEQVGQSGFIVFIQDTTGGRTVSLGTDYETAGGSGLTLSSAASTTDIVPYVVAASGRILLGAPQLAFS